MNIVIDLFVAAGLFALLWAIIGGGSAPARAGAATFGVLLTIAAILGAGREDDYRRRDW